ncbi:MAG: DegV family protein [Lachnospiraceae bacterium]|nr:DegV family protein [Lachnospiraceae bacterium]
MIRIAADSTCDLSPELVERYGIEIIPLYVILDDREYQDGINITPSEIYDWSDEVKRVPKTSSPTLPDAVEAFRRLVGPDDELIVFTISSKMSTTINVFTMAAEELGISDRVSIVDSMNLSTGIGLQVIAAAEKAAEGLSRAEIVSYIESIRPKVRASFVVDTLVYLYRGGRCNGLAALVGGMLKLHPRINVADGAMGPGQKYRGKMSHVILEYAKEMEPMLLNARKEHVFITHSLGVEEEAIQAVRSYLESLNYFDEIHETIAGGVISSHCGPGTLGVLFIEKP